MHLHLHLHLHLHQESAEEAIVKIRNAGQSNTPLAYLSNQILYPLVQVPNSMAVCYRCRNWFCYFPRQVVWWRCGRG